jgi:predicted ATP-dependent endonuclease of OLD family
MRISAIRIENFRALRDIPIIEFTEMPVIVGKNDTGKSSILYALAVFFEERTLTSADFTRGTNKDEPLKIEVHFTELPENATKTLAGKKLLSCNNNLIIKKIFKLGAKQPDFSLLVKDFVDPEFQNLQAKKERELNELGKKYNLAFVKAGRSITNESKITELVNYARSKGIGEADVWEDLDKDTINEVASFLPRFTMFPSSMNLSIDQAQFQNPFLEMIVNAIEIDQTIKETVQGKVAAAISEAIGKIEENLIQQTDTVKKLIPKPTFQWKRLVNLDIETEDQFGACVPLQNRGLGVQRLVMVAFLKYVAEKPLQASDPSNMIFAIEEPETFLHPSAQRDLIESFRELRSKGYQIIMTSHSPVFVAEAHEEDLILVTRQTENASIVCYPQLQTEQIVTELGILPRDQIVSFNAIVFVEGPSDQFFFESVVKTMKQKGLISTDFAEKKIGLFSIAGNNLEFCVEKHMLKQLNRKFGVVVDSDKKNPTDQLKKKKTDWKCRCEADGGKFFILRKREIENYLHPAAIQRALNLRVTVEEFNDVRRQISSDYSWEKHLKPIVKAMTADEILVMDKYTEDNTERHEILDIVKELLGLSD